MGRRRAGFGRQQRLRTPAAYQRVFKRARRSRDDYWLVLARDNHNGAARLGLAIARRKIPAAVARNRVKRIVRESFRHHQQQLSGLDLVVQARADLSNVPNHVLFDSLARLWQHIGGRQG